MQPISFGNVAVQNPGTPVRMGWSTLASAMLSADETMTVTSSAPFCNDMIPFKMDINPSGAVETVMVLGISGTTHTIRRGVDGTTPRAHGTGTIVCAKFPFAGWDIESKCGSAGRLYWGTKNLDVSTGAGIIKEFVPNPASASFNDHFQHAFHDEGGNSLTLTDYATDADVASQGLRVTLWKR